MQKPNPTSNTRWGILILGCLTNALVVAVPGMSLSVLLPEISRELNLNLVQAGLVWGMSAVPIIFSGILAGVLSDRWGPKRILTWGSLLVGLLGASRGFSQNLGGLLTIVFMFGFFSPFITISNIKNVGIWFSDREFGFANGILSLGMALGFFLGSMVSASIISPWIGGWRYTFFLYGAAAIIFTSLWLFSPASPQDKTETIAEPARARILQDIKHIISLRSIWLLGFALLCFNGAVQGFLGYLPLYLRNLGWPEIRADGLAASFHLASMIFTIPLTIFSDRLGTRKKIVLGAAMLTTLGIGLVYLLQGNSLWGAVLTAGLVRDGFMALLITMISETRGVGRVYAGIATGFIMVFSGIGALAAPPLGNRLAVLTPNAPFLLWAVLGAACVVCIALIPEIRLKRSSQTAESAAIPGDTA